MNMQRREQSTPVNMSLRTFTCSFLRSYLGKYIALNLIFFVVQMANLLRTLVVRVVHLDLAGCITLRTLGRTHCAR